ncbi:MAG: hypothetical protein LAT82_00600 [Nanoarchaeota archaeon]|nr:hypothetical protein [Nanoarchaeota archaeon]
MEKESLKNLIKKNFNFNWLIFTNNEIKNIQNRIFQKDNNEKFTYLEEIAYEFENWAKEQNLIFWR